jgi:hypothetical protein
VRHGMGAGARLRTMARARVMLSVMAGASCARERIGGAGEDARARTRLRPTQERAVDSARGLSSGRCAGVVQRAVHSGCATTIAKSGWGTRALAVPYFYLILRRLPGVPL